MKSRIFLSAIFGLLLISGSSRGDILKIERLIHLPDGKPAAGAKVLIRSLNTKDGTLRQEKYATADELGVVRSEIDHDSSQPDDPIRITGYMVVDVPGTALAFEKFSNWRRRRDVEPLKLSSGYFIKGKTVSATGEPIANAQIVLAAFASHWANWRINYATANITTPEAVTRSNADGTFELRNVDIVEQTFGNGPPAVRPLLVASAEIDNKLFTGRSEAYATKATTIPANQSRENTIRLLPTSSVQGRIVNDLNQQPIAGAQIHLRADPGDDVAALISPTTSKPDGTFEFKGIPAAFQLFAVASHPDFAGGYSKIGQGQQRIGADAPTQHNDITISMRPWATVSGRVVDVATGAPPITATSITTIFTEGYNDGRIAVGRGTATSKANADGTFSMKMPIGPNQVRVRGAGYWEGGYDHPISLDIKPDHNPNQKFEVRREKGFLTHFSTNAATGKPDYDIDREYDLLFRGRDGKVSSTNWSEWWWWPLYKPDDTLEISATRFVDGYSQQVLPWTQLTPNTPEQPVANHHWPREIQLPLHQTITVRGRVVDRATGQPLAGASVKLISQPAAAAQKIAPILSDDKGNFEFKNVPLPSELLVHAAVQQDGKAAEDYFPGATRVGQGILSAVAVTTDEGHQEVNDVLVRPASIVAVTGKLIDADTGAILNSLPNPNGISIHSATDFAPLISSENNSSGQKSLQFDNKYADNARIAPDGSFSIKMPIGKNTLNLGGGYIPELIELDVPANGFKEDVLIKTKRKPGAALHLMRNDSSQSQKFKIDIVRQDYKTSGELTLRKGQTESYWFFPADRWDLSHRVTVKDTATNVVIYQGEFVNESLKAVHAIQLLPPPQ